MAHSVYDSRFLEALATNPKIGFTAGTNAAPYNPFVAQPPAAQRAPKIAAGKGIGFDPGIYDAPSPAATANPFGQAPTGTNLSSGAGWNTGSGPNSTVGNIVGSGSWFEDPTGSTLAWLAQNGYGGSTNDPWVQALGTIMAGMPQLYRLGGNAYDAANGVFSDWSTGLINSLITPNGGGGVDYGSSPLFSPAEMQAGLSALLSGDPAAISTAFGGGSDQTGVAAALNNLKVGSDSQAMGSFLDMLSSMAVASMAPSEMSTMQDQVRAAFQLWSAQQGINGTAPISDPSNPANNTNRFWQWLTSDPTILQQYFGV